MTDSAGLQGKHSKDSPPGLAEVENALTRALADGRVDGGIVRVICDGELVHSDARGVLDAGTRFPLQPDTVLWLASLSKVVCATAVLTLVDDGKVDLDDPVSRFIPEFAEPGTVRMLAADSPPLVPSPPFGPPPDPLPIYDLVPADREIRIRDVLTHTSGLQSMSQYNADYAGPRPGDTLATHVPTLARVPRDFQPGSSWAYSNAAAFELAARTIEVASGLDYAAYLQDRLFDPLRMHDVGFGLAGHERAMPAGRFAGNPVVDGTTFSSGSAGIWSTPGDYLVFVEMLRAGGVANNDRVLSAESATTLSTNQIGAVRPVLNGRPRVDGVGYGMAVAVIDDPHAAGTPLAAGTFGWDGINTRRFWADPTHGWSLFMLAPDLQLQLEVEAAVAAALN